MFLLEWDYNILFILVFLTATCIATSVLLWNHRHIHIVRMTVLYGNKKRYILRGHYVANGNTIEILLSDPLTEGFIQSIDFKFHDSYLIYPIHNRVDTLFFMQNKKYERITPFCCHKEKKHITFVFQSYHVTQPVSILSLEASKGKA